MKEWQLHEAEGKAKPQTAHDALVLTEDFPGLYY